MPNGEHFYPAHHEKERSPFGDNHTFVDETRDAFGGGGTVVRGGIKKERERFTEASLDASQRLSAFFKDLPRSMTLPATQYMMHWPEEKIAKEVEMYRFLDSCLKSILHPLAPDVHLPSFDEIMNDAARVPDMQNALTRKDSPGFFLRNQFRERIANMLSKDLSFEAGNLLTLFAAFAETLGNAQCLRKMGSL